MSLRLTESDAVTDDLLRCILASFPNLTELDLSGCEYVTDAGIQLCAKKTTPLKALRIDRCGYVTEASLLQLIRAQGVKLRVLSLRECTQIPDAVIKELFVAQPKKLQELNVSDCPRLTDACMEYLSTVPSYYGNRVATAYHELVRIDVSGCEAFTSLVCCWIAASCPFLTSLKAARCVGLCDKAALALASLVHLAELDVSSCTNISGAAVERLFQSDGKSVSSASTLTASASSREVSLERKLSSLSIACCPSQGDKSVLAIVNSCSKTLVQLDLSDIAPLPSTTLTRLAKKCKALTELRLRGQLGVTRAVLAHLASRNKVLRLLDLRNCAGVDDLAIYPLLVMQSLEELYLTGCRRITKLGLRSLPANLTRFELQRSQATDLDDEACSVLASRVRKLEKLDVSFSAGVSSTGLAEILRQCVFLSQVNVFRCPKIRVSQLDRLARSIPANKYDLEVIDDPEMAFCGISSADVRAAEQAHRREKALEEQQKMHQAATAIQLHYTSRCRYLQKKKAQEDQEWEEFCSAVDIQRVYRGHRCRQTYCFVREKVKKAVVYLQYLWRKKLQQRRVRKAAAYWSNRVVLKLFFLWKQEYFDARMERERAKAAVFASKALSFWGEKTLGRVFAAWRAFVKTKIVKAKKAIGFWKCQSLPRVLDAWRVHTDAEKLRRQRLVCVFLNAVELETHNSSIQLEKSVRASPVVAGLEMNSCRSCSNRIVCRSEQPTRWQSAWSGGCGESSLANRSGSCSKRRSRSCAGCDLHCLSAFVLVGLSCASRNSLHLHPVPHVLQSLSAWAFRQWHQNARYNRQSREKTRKMLLKIVHREKTSVWNSWLEFVHDQKAKKRALLRFSSSIQVKCWLKWRQYHDELARLKNVSGRVASRFKLLGAGKAVATWYEFTQEQIEAKQRMRRALAFFTNATLVRTFASWAGCAEYMKAFRYRMKARMENANLAYALTSWVTFTRLRKELHATVTKLQAFWRGTLTRRAVEDEYFRYIWAAVLIQTAWRGRLGRLIMRAATRKARLREYLRAERERDAMDAEETAMRTYNREIDMIVLLQRQWRGVAARQLFVEVRRARFLLKKQQEAELQEIIRAQARQRALDRIQHEKNRQLAATEIQRHIRGYLGRKWYRSQQDFLHQQRAALRVQAVYRGRMSRRRTSALRRSYITRMEILARRAVEGKLLRTLGAKTRPTQRGLRSFLEFFGLDPATFLTDIRVVLKEVKEDFQTMKKFFDVIKVKVNANAAKAALADAAKASAAASAGAASAKGLVERATNLAKKTDAAKKFLNDLEQIVDATTAEKEKHDQAILPGMAVRIVLRGHHRCGETAFVLCVKEEIAQVKMDVDGALEFFPLMIPATKVEPAKCVLHKIPELAFTAAYTNTVNGKISATWRGQLEAYAETIANESRRYCAARVIQCTIRVYLARMKYQEELEAQGVNAARRQQALLRVLKTFGCANTRIANILLQLRFVRALNLPPNLPDEPLEVQKVLDRFQRWLGRRSEINQAFLRLAPEEFKGEGEFYGQMMPAPYTRVLDKLVHYPIQWLKRATCVPVANQLEKQGMAELAAFIGGSEFMKTFEELHTDAREHFFPQLQHCSFCASEGWALVHGVFQKRRVPVSFPSLANSSKKKKYVTKLVPHGWGVAHFLTGSAGKNVNWLARNSIEARFKSLQVVKAMKQQEREERLESQILARQGTLNTLRSAEGARGYAKRHSELSVLEEKTKAFYKRYGEEIALREREEAKIFDEEQRLNALVAKEKHELHLQGLHLNVLQQQVPEVVVEIDVVKSAKSALEFLAAGCFIEVEYDDEVWYQCQLLKIDPFDTFTADVLYVEDQRRETIKLIEASTLEEKQFQRAAPPTPKTIAEITAAAAALAQAQEVPFRRWRAGCAVDLSWEPPFDNGTVITQYVIEWRDEADETVTGKKEVSGGGGDDYRDADGDRSGRDSLSASPRRSPAPTKTTLWPIPPERAETLCVRIAAENKKGVGLASVYTALPAEITDVSYLTAEPLTRPPEDTSALERGEREKMASEDDDSLEHRRRLTCTICLDNQPREEDVHEHVARTHAVPLICPFRSCQQVCASEQALRYHIWRCSIPKPTVEEQQSELFMEIFNLSRQYCLRKPRRHILPPQSALYTGDTFDAATAEEMYLESKYEEARVAWFAKAREIHEAGMRVNATMRRRERENRYEPPSELFGVDFASPELNVARRNAVVSAIQVLQTDLAAYVLETNTQMDQLKHEEKELLDYVALKVKRMKTSEEEWQKQSLQREKKKAMKSLSVVQEKIAVLTTTSTRRIDELTAEINRLTTIERAFVPFTHQVIKTLRLGTLIKQTHSKSNEILKTHRVILAHFQEELRKLMTRAQREVEGLEAWDAMIEARRKQLQALKDELRRLQLMHLAELQSYKQKRDEGDEMFELKKLREQQIHIITRQERAAQELLESRKQARAREAAKALSGSGANADETSFELSTTIKSLAIVNHDLVLHEKFIKGKSADAEYLRDEEAAHPEDGKNDGGGGNTKLVDEVARSENSEPVTDAAAAAASSVSGGQSSGEQSSETSGAGINIDGDTVGDATGGNRKAKPKRKKLSELPHTYVRLECCFQDGFIRDHVRIEYNDGSTYEGPWAEDVHFDKPTGDLEPAKTRFTPMHWGKFIYRDGTVWEGEDVDNFFSPFTATGDSFHVTTPMASVSRSSLSSPSSSNKYIGAVRMGKYHGFGTLHMNYTFSKGEYTGEWCEGKRHGYGIERFDVGEIYEGYWEQDVYHGEGEIVYDDGSRYEGAFRFGKWHGDGVRTLENGDRIIGSFRDGFLNGPGIMEFADKRHYHGDFKNTRRHGVGVLNFPNGDRYEGPFEDDLQHGEGRFITKGGAGAGGDGGREPLVRIGKWVRGERTAWLNRPSSELATSTFIQYFAVLSNATGELEMDLVLPKFKTPYAVMVASMLPNLPEGVNADDAFVKTIVRMLAKTQNVMVGTDVLDKTVVAHTQVKQLLDQEVIAFEALRNSVDQVEREFRAQTKKVNELQDEVDAMTAKEQEMQVKLETFWKKDAMAQGHERAYKRAVDALHGVDAMDWFKLRTAKLDAVYLSLLEAFAVLLNFTDNFYLAGKLYKPTKEDLMQLLSSSQENVFLGDKEGLIHKYDVKALYVLPLFDVYSFGEGTRNAMLHSITHVIHHPRLRPNNLRLHQISPAATAVCTWVRAAFFYAKKATEIYPVMKRVLGQLVVLERLRDSLENEKKALAEEQIRVDAARQQLADGSDRIEELRRREQELQRVITGIEELDRDENVPIEKQRVKRPQTNRPPSAGVAAVSQASKKVLDKDGDTDGGGSDPKSGANTTAAEEKTRSAAAPTPEVNHRQVFEESHDERESEKQAQRVQKETVLAQIVSNAELAQEFAILKKEIRKVIDRCDGKVALHAFPAAFEKVMLKALEPSAFGVKKLRTLLALMDDTCVIVEPQKEGEVETVQFPVDPEEVGGMVLPPRLASVCRFCPGISYATKSELAIHETTKWHYWNVQRKQQGEPPAKWTLAATFWSEAYDSVDGAICYYNRMTGEIVKGSEPPLEMQAGDVMLELLEDKQEEVAGDEGATASEELNASDALATHTKATEHYTQQQEAADPWEEVADDAGNVYFSNRWTGETSWTRPMTGIVTELPSA